MTRREFLREQYEDAQFAMLMDELAHAEGEKMLEECKRLQEDPDAAVPDLVVERGLKTIRRRFRKKSAETFWRATTRVASCVAVVFLVLTLSFTTALAASPEFRIKALNFVASVFDDHISFGGGNADAERNQTVFAGWLPEGYKQISYEDKKMHVSLLFGAPDEKRVSVEVHDESENFVLDTELAEVGTALVNGYEVKIVIKNGVDGFGNSYKRCSVIWVDTKRECLIIVQSNNEEVETLLRIASALELK